MGKLFYSESESDKDDAKRICRTCPVRKECLAYALINQEPNGVWGGYDYKERKHIRSIAVLSPNFDSSQSAIIDQYRMPELLSPIRVDAGFNFRVDTGFNFHVAS